MRRWGPFVLLVLAALGLWALYLATDPVPPHAEPSETEIETQIESAPGLAGRADDTPLEHTAEDSTSPNEEKRSLRSIPLPEDPLEVGTCTLHLSVVDEEGRPASTTLDLWRVGAPASKHFETGDQLQVEELVVGKDRPTVQVEDLPAGLYRAFLHNLPKTHDDPLAFRVEGAHTTVVLDMPQRRLRSITLRVFDHQGNEVLEGTRVRYGLSTASYDEDARPPWLNPRKPKAPPPGSVWESEGMGGMFGRSSGRTRGLGLETVRGVPFAWATFRDDGRVEQRTQSTRFLREGWSKLRVPLRGSVGHDHTLVGVIVPVETIAREILLPTGERADTHPEARIRIESEAVLDESLETSTPWLDLKVTVSAVVPGYKSLSLKFTLREGWPETRTLERAPATD